MEDLGPREDELLQKLRDSRRRFQRRMQQLIEKYNQPFEDDPLVHMATLTYQTPQGLKVWGGKLIKEGSKGLIQDPPGGPWEDSIEGLRHAAAQGDAPPLSGMPVLGAGSGSGHAEAASDAGSPEDQALVPTVPWSPLENELRRRYLTQVDALLQDAGCFEGAGKRSATDTPRTLVPSLASPATHGPGCSAENPSEPTSPTEWDPLCPCPTDLATAPRNDSLSLLGTSSSSCMSGQSFQADDICDVTISDLYVGMLHSMSQLLSTKPASVISTRTFIFQSRSSRRRPARRGRARPSQASGARGRRSRRERPAPCSEPQQELGPLGDGENSVHGTRQKPGLKLDKAFLAENKAPVLKLDSGWKELQVTPRKHSSLTPLDLNTVHHPDQENRLTMLKWLISPVKIRVSGPRMLPIQAENRYREIKVRFNKLHQECCPEGLRGSGAVDVHRGGSGSPGALRGLETRRWSLPFSKAKAKRLSEAFKNLGTRCVDVGRGPPERHLSPSPKDSPSQSRSHCWQTSGLFQGHNSGTFRKAISVPRIEPLGCGRNRYNEIKEKFDQLHQKCCQVSPPRAKAPACLGMPPGEASAEVQLQTQELGKSHRDSLFQQWSPSRQWYLPSPQGSPAHAAGRDPQFPAKRRRLSDSQVCGHRAGFQDPSEVDEADPRPGEQGSHQAGW